MEEGWLAWWMGDGLRECDWEQPPDMPEMWLWGHHVDMMFDHYSNDKASVVRDQLIDMFRRGSVGHGDLQELLADMLDPAKKTPWRLDLRRRRGNPGKLSMMICNISVLATSSEWTNSRVRAAPRR
jgi:hypothetical protein